MEKICFFCNFSFITYRNKRKFCSHKCSNSHKNSIKKNGKFIECIVCKNSFYRSAKISKTAKFCSRNCLYIWMKKEKISNQYGFQSKENKKQRRKYKQLRINGKNMTEHRFIMETYLGRKLSRFEHVHHINNDPIDNRIENLIILSHSDHSKTTCKNNDNYKRN